MRVSPTPWTMEWHGGPNVAEFFDANGFLVGLWYASSRNVAETILAAVNGLEQCGRRVAEQGIKLP